MSRSQIITALLVGVALAAIVAAGLAGRAGADRRPRALPAPHTAAVAAAPIPVDDASLVLPPTEVVR